MTRVAWWHFVATWVQSFDLGILDLAPSSFYVQLESLLARYLTRMNAASVLRRAIRKHGLQPHAVSPAHLERLHPELRMGLLFFADQQQREAILQKLEKLGRGRLSLPPMRRVVIQNESDIAAARNVAKGLCEAMGASPLTTHKTATVVSELTRNIVLYAGEGEVSMEFAPSGELRRMWIIASDDGPGIEALDLVLSGEYRSKTGMGKGLLGVSRLCEKFNVETGPTGTTVKVEVSWS